jgi:hypothetical protein
VVLSKHRTIKEVKQKISDASGDKQSLINSVMLINKCTKNLFNLIYFYSTQTCFDTLVSFITREQFKVL